MTHDAFVNVINFSNEVIEISWDIDKLKEHVEIVGGGVDEGCIDYAYNAKEDEHGHRDRFKRRPSVIIEQSV